MRRTFICITIILGLISFSALTFQEQNGLHGNAAGAPSGKTGSPGDNSNCTSCHSGSATSQTGLITSNIPLYGYTPGTTYTITGSITDATVTKFGFEISPQRTSGALVGTMMLSDAAKTRFVGTGNKYITHTSAGTSFPSHTATWSFVWVAPSAGTGSFTFYGAFNLTNSNNASSGDRIVLSQLAVIENTSTGIETLTEANPFSVYPNPASDRITIALKNQNHNTSAQLSNLTGAVVKTVSDLNSVSNELTISELPSGIYFLTITSGESVFTKKIVKL